MLFGFLLRPSGIGGFNELGDFVAFIAGIISTIFGFLLGGQTLVPPGS